MNWLCTLLESAVETVKEPTYFEKMFKKIGEIEPRTWIALAALVALAVVLMLVGKKAKWSATTIAFAALTIALSFLLSNIRLYRMPQGGSITPASMLPLMLFAYAFGTVPGLLTGLAYGVLQYLQTPGMLPIAPFYAVCQIVLDYLLAFAMVGLAGLFRGWTRKGGKEPVALGCGITLAMVMRFVCTVASGVLFFAEYAEGSGQSPLVYSILYNGAYMLPETVICVALGMLIGPRLAKALRRAAGLRGAVPVAAEKQ